jgi:hypothetical protein
MLIDELCPDKQAINFQDDLLIKGTIYSPLTLPPVVEMNEPSDDHDNLLLIDIPIDYLKYDWI